MTQNLNQIAERIYLGNGDASKNRDLLKQFGITHILNATFEISNSFPESFEYLQLPLDDTPEFSIENYFEIASLFIESAVSKGKILVHCAAGISRSASLLAGYLIKKYLITPELAIGFLASQRSIVNPNLGFRRKLKNYYSFLHDK